MAEGCPGARDEFTIVAADLPGYGESILSDVVFADGHVTKRTMASALADAMSELGIARFAVVGHDRGARVAYRLALDQPERIGALAVLDVIPILDMAERLTYEILSGPARCAGVVDDGWIDERWAGTESRRR